MITVLVKYKEYISGHPLLDDEPIEGGKIVKVNDLLELNELFDIIIDVKIIREQ